MESTDHSPVSDTHSRSLSTRPHLDLPSRRFRPTVNRQERAIAPWIQLLRPSQWIKNLTCFAGLIFSGQLFHAVSQWEAIKGFWAFCFMSSTVYILNDIIDRDRDKLNPRTATRPLASGTISMRSAILLAVALIILAALLSSTLGTACSASLAVYGVMNVFYSLWLKRVVIVDVMCIAVGFVIRVMFGVYAVEDLPTPWIALCMFFLALLLGFSKRKAELINQSHRSSSTARAVLRKYEPAYLDTLVTMSATMSILCYALFTVSSHRNPTLIITIVPVIYCVLRYLLQVILAGKGESPDEILISDKRLWTAVLIWLTLYCVIMYGNINIFASQKSLIL